MRCARRSCPIVLLKEPLTHRTPVPFAPFQATLQPAPVHVQIPMRGEPSPFAFSAECSSYHSGPPDYPWWNVSAEPPRTGQLSAAMEWTHPYPLPHHPFLATSSQPVEESRLRTATLQTPALDLRPVSANLYPLLDTIDPRLTLTPSVPASTSKWDSPPAEYSHFIPYAPTPHLGDMFSGDMWQNRFHADTVSFNAERTPTDSGMITPTSTSSWLQQAQLGCPVSGAEASNQGATQIPRSRSTSHTVDTFRECEPLTMAESSWRHRASRVTAQEQGGIGQCERSHRESADSMALHAGREAAHGTWDNQGVREEALSSALQADSSTLSSSLKQSNPAWGYLAEELGLPP